MDRRSCTNKVPEPKALLGMSEDPDGTILAGNPMSQTYKATGINLKGMPLGETDRILTILTPEYGLVRAVAPGVRKPKSKLGGRGELFVVNQLLLAQGRSLDRVLQAETLMSYPGLSQDLGKLAAGQYLAELVLYQALSGNPQVDLFNLFTEHLSRLEQSPREWVLARLAHGTYHLLALAGIAPQVQWCCFTQEDVFPDFGNPDWRIGFSVAAGGAVSLKETVRPVGDVICINATELMFLQSLSGAELKPLESSIGGTTCHDPGDYHALALEAIVLKAPNSPKLPLNENDWTHPAWGQVERLLRRYAQYHLGRTIRSASLIEVCFPVPSTSPTCHATA